MTSHPNFGHTVHGARSKPAQSRCKATAAINHVSIPTLPCASSIRSSLSHKEIPSIHIFHQGKSRASLRDRRTRPGHLVGQSSRRRRRRQLASFQILADSPVNLPDVSRLNGRLLDMNQLRAYTYLAGEVPRRAYDLARADAMTAECLAKPVDSEVICTCTLEMRIVGTPQTMAARQGMLTHATCPTPLAKPLSIRGSSALIRKQCPGACVQFH